MTERAFANATEFDMWADRYCFQCAKDYLGGAISDEDGEELHCPILTDVICLNEVPPQWQVGGGFANYHCTEFEKSV
jgi:hypothetical protein